MPDEHELESVANSDRTTAPANRRQLLALMQFDGSARGRHAAVATAQSGKHGLQAAVTATNS